MLIILGEIELFSNRAQNMLISIIVPVYNEIETILVLLKKIKNLNLSKFELETIVIDDNSNDGTKELLRNNSHLFSKLIELSKNTGKGGAVREGLKIANGEYVLFQDADLEYDPNEYEKIFNLIREFNAEVVFGSRFLGPEYTKVHYFFNKLGNKFITNLFNFLYNKTFTDIYSCYLCYKKSLLDINKIKSDGWSQQAEILASLCKTSNKIYEVPISYNGRTYEDGKKIKARHVIAVIFMILRKRFY